MSTRVLSPVDRVVLCVRQWDRLLCECQLWRVPGIALTRDEDIWVLADHNFAVGNSSECHLRGVGVHIARRVAFAIQRVAAARGHANPALSTGPGRGEKG